MVKKSWLNVINASFFVVVAFANTITGIIEGYDIKYYIAYAGFFAVAAALYIFRNKVTPKMTASLFLLFSAASIIFGDYGNLTGAIFFCYAIFIYEKRIIFILGSIGSAVGIILMSIINDYMASQIVVYLAGYAYVIAVYWVLIHPRPSKIVKMVDDVDAQIMTHIVNGLRQKEIGPLVGLGSDGVSKRINRAKEKLGAKSIEHLAVIMSRNGQIDIK